MKPMHTLDKGYRNKAWKGACCGVREMPRKKWHPLLCAFFVCWFVSLAVEAYPSADGPADHVRNLLEGVSDVLEGRVDPTIKGQSGKTEAIKRLIEMNFDQVAMARGALEGTWDSITDKERDEFLGLFRALFLESYSKLVLNFLKREELEITGESDADGRKEILTRIRRKNDEIPVSYYLRKEGERWLIVEVDVDGVGIVRNYKRAFGKVIHKTSFADLLERMRIHERALKRGPEPG